MKIRRLGTDAFNKPMAPTIFNATEHFPDTIGQSQWHTNLNSAHAPYQCHPADMANASQGQRSVGCAI